MLQASWTRRFFQQWGLGALAATVGVQVRAANSPNKIAVPVDAFNPVVYQTRKRLLRIAHLTDIHVTRKFDGMRGMADTLKQVHDLHDRPELILFGGDCIMDGFAQTRDTTTAYWREWHAMLRDCDIPTRSCIGNHDLWGWAKSKSGASGQEPDYGKAWAVDALKLSRRYYSFDQAGWHFIVLDSTHPHAKNPEAYEARLDQEQFDWLKQDLQAVPAATPILVLSHIPILSASCYLDGENEKNGRDWVVPGSWMHLDARRILELFHAHRNVKLCLSGHIHLYDRTDYNGVTYLCNGAVCGKWWEGMYHQTPSGYGLIDLYSDGGFENIYVANGWKPVKS